MKSNIALIGFMGAGKTAVGKAVAERLGRRFIEMDSLIEQRAGKPVAEIFAQDGEIAFRELEIAVAREVSAEENAVIACGGGVVLNQINVDRLRQKSRVVYLTALPAAILKRVLDDGGERPLLRVANLSLAIHELLRLRRPFYERAADIKVDTSRRGVAAVAEQIIEKLKADEGFNF